MLLQMYVHRMGPIAGSVEQDPVLHGVLLHQEAEMVAGHELAVDGPLAIQAVEFERASDAWRRRGVRQRVERRVGRRIHTPILDPRRTYLELQQEVALPSRQTIVLDVGVRAGAFKMAGGEARRRQRAASG